MTKEEFAELLKTSCNGNPILGVVLAERQQYEKQVLKKLLEERWGIVCVGEAVQQFYYDTSKLFFSRALNNSQLTDKDRISINWHIVAQSRFYTATDLLCRGYFYDSMPLARSLFETALTIVALEKGIVEVAGLFAGGDNLTGQEIAKHDRELDRKIKNSLIWKNTGLSDEARKALETILHLNNTATHKSKLHLLMNAGKMSADETLFPHYEERPAEVASNILFETAWMLMMTLGYLRPIITAIDQKWPIRHAAIVEALSVVGSGPSVAAKGFSEFLKVVI